MKKLLAALAIWLAAVPAFGQSLGSPGGGGGGLASNITVGTSVITGGTNTRVLFDNSGILGEYAITGTGNVVMSASPTFTGVPVLAAPTATTITIGAGSAITSSGAGGALGTAAFVNTGTSGATIPLLNAANTWSGAQSFNSSDLILNGATSGTIILNAAAIAGSNTLTLPAGTTDFSATGGTSQVVKQTSAGGAFTVARLACADLSNAGTGCTGSSTAAGVTIGTSTITSGTTTRLLYDNAGVFGETTVTTDGTALTIPGTLTTGAGPAIITSPAAASLQLGAADVDTTAAMVAQTLRTQGALTGGTTNQAGKNLTFIVSPGKGTGAGGSFIVQTAPAGGSGTTVGTPTTGLTIDSTQLATFAGAVTVTGHTTFEGVTSTGATGTGKIVYDGTPTLVTPVIGAATGTSVTFGSTSLTGTKFTLASGTLADTVNSFVLTATMPTTITGLQDAVAWTITSAGSSGQTNRAFSVTYAAGYTGSTNTSAGAFINAAAGTGSTVIPASGSNTQVSNAAINSQATATTAGFNVGNVGKGSAGNVNAGLMGLAQIAKNSATNIGVIGSAINTGSSPVHVGGWFSLNQTTVPTVNAALIADNGAQSDAIALFRAAGSTVASANATGGLTATLTNVATTSAVCYAIGTNGLLSYNSTVGTCTVSDGRLKNVDGPLTNSLDRLLQIKGIYYHWKDPSSDRARQIGVIAQDVEKVFPELVSTDSKGTKSADYLRLTAPIIEAIRELKADNDNLRAEIVALKARRR